MSLPCRPYFNWGYDLESEYTFTHPQKPWKFARGGVGGSDTAASGIPEAFVIRRDRIVRLELRVLESELAVFDEFMDWAQDSGSPFNFRFDTDDITNTFSVYLHSMRWEDGPEFDYERDTAYPSLFIIPFALRTELGGEFDALWSSLAISEEDEES